MKKILSSPVLPLFLAVITIAILPDLSFAGEVIEEFASPTETWMNTLRGPWAKFVSIIMILAAALTMWFKKDDLDGMAKGALVVVCIISILALAEPIVNKLFNFGSGALI